MYRDSMYYCFFFFKDQATTENYTYLHTLSLHDALPSFGEDADRPAKRSAAVKRALRAAQHFDAIDIVKLEVRLRRSLGDGRFVDIDPDGRLQIGRAPSELQSLMRISYAVFCLKKKKNNK